MNIYVISMAITILYSVLIECSNIGKKNKKNLLFLVSFNLWGGIMMFRGESVGTDTWNYKAIYTNISSSSFFDIFEQGFFFRMPIYFIYNKMLGVFFPAPNSIVIANSVVYMIGMLLFLYKNSKKYSISILCFLCFHYFFYAMNGTRMALAVMVMLWSYHYGVRGEKRKSIIFAIVAVLVHVTALVGIVIPWLSNQRMTYRKFKVVSLAAVTTILSLRVLSKIFVIIFPVYIGYIDTIYNVDEAGGRRGIIALFLICIFGICVYWKKTNQLKDDTDETFWRLLTFSIIAILSMIIWGKVYTFARLEYFYNCFFMLLIPYCVEQFFTTGSKIIMYGGIISVMLIPFYIKLSDFLPYVAVWAE